MSRINSLLKKEFIDFLSLESKAKYIFIADLLEGYGKGLKSIM